MFEASLSALVGFEVFSADDKVTYRVALSYSHHVAASTFVDDLADFAVETSVRHRLLLTGINFYDNAVAVIVVVEELGEFGFAFSANWLFHEAACARTISF